MNKQQARLQDRIGNPDHLKIIQINLNKSEKVHLNIKMKE